VPVGLISRTSDAAPRHQVDEAACDDPDDRYPDDESLQRRMRYKPRYVIDDLPAARGASTVQTDPNSAQVGPPGRR